MTLLDRRLPSVSSAFNRRKSDLSVRRSSSLPSLPPLIPSEIPALTFPRTRGPPAAAFFLSPEPSPFNGQERIGPSPYIREGGNHRSKVEKGSYKSCIPFTVRVLSKRKGLYRKSPFESSAFVLTCGGTHGEASTESTLGV